MLIWRVEMHGCKNITHIYQVYLMLTMTVQFLIFISWKITRMDLHQCPIFELETMQARIVMLSLGWIFTIKYDENDLLGQLKSNPSPFLRNISLESMTEAEGKCCIWNIITIQNIFLLVITILHSTFSQMAQSQFFKCFL